MTNTVHIKPVEKQHLRGCLALINELALYEKAPDEVDITLEVLEEDFRLKRFQAFVAEREGEVLGMALYYPIYSTWKGHSIHLEDLVVLPQHRRMGIGKQLLKAVIEEAKTQNVGRLQWQVLDWNLPAIEFYKQYGAELDGEWINVKLSRKALHKQK